METRNMSSAILSLHAELEVALRLEDGQTLTYDDIDEIFLDHRAKKPSNLKSELAPRNKGSVPIGWVPARRIKKMGKVYISDARQLP